MKIPFGKPLIDNKEIKLVKEVLKSPILTHGEKSIRFENEFAKYNKTKNCTTTSSCTSALHLSYLAIGLKKGDEVIVPAQTHVATVHSVEITGAKPIFVDADCNGNIDINLIEKKINKKTKCITVVHYLGLPVDMPKIMKLAKKYKLFTVEDCALALGAKIGTKHVGTFADFGCFSFYPAKHITTGDGGMLIVKSNKNFILTKRLKGFGVDKTFKERKIPGVYDVKQLGLNFRMSEVQAAMGVAQMKKLDFILKIRKRNFKLLKSKLNFSKLIKVLNTDCTKKYKSSYYALSILLNAKLKKKRELLIKKLNSYGVGTSIYYPKVITDFTYYKKKYKINSFKFPNARKISYESITLPVGPHISLDGINYMVKKIKKSLMELS
jgi:perosamine synthetase